MRNSAVKTVHFSPEIWEALEDLIDHHLVLTSQLAALSAVSAVDPIWLAQIHRDIERADAVFVKLVRALPKKS